VKRIPYFCCFLFLPVLLTQNASAQNPRRIVHVFVALADNEHQGIVPVPQSLGNGSDAERNLYWGAAFGVKTVFSKSADWARISIEKKVEKALVERAIFVHLRSKTILIADAYRGSEIKQAVADFFSAAAGLEPAGTFEIESNQSSKKVEAMADLVVYVGHDGLMDFSMEKAFPGKNEPKRQAIVLACASKQYFGAGLKQTGAEPLLWTTNLMAPEAYTLKAALDGWIAGETNDQVRQRAAAAYAKYQKISERAALKLFTTGW